MDLKERNVKITVERMPVHILVAGFIFTIYGLSEMFLSDLKWVYALVFVLGLIMLTSRQMVNIDHVNKTYSEYKWVLGFKFENYTASFEHISSLSIKGGNYSQQYGMYVRRFISGVIYKMYLDLPGDDPLFLGQSKSLKKIRDRAEKLAKRLSTQVRDTTKD